MRGKTCSMDGLPDFTPSSFYVPGERHENLPVNMFAGPRMMSHAMGSMGTPVQSLWPDNRPAEYATGGSGMFQGADFGSGGGKLIALRGPGARVGRVMGQDDSGGSSLTDLLSQGLSTASDIAQAVTPGQAAAAATTAAAKPAASASTSFMSKKIAGIPMVAVLALAVGAGAFFYMRKKK